MQAPDAVWVTPRPRVMVASGSVLVSVTSTCPSVATMKRWYMAPLAASEPVKVSVDRVGEGVTEGDVDEPQDARATANPAASHARPVQFRFVMDGGSFKPPIIPMPRPRHDRDRKSTGPNSKHGRSS